MVRMRESSHFGAVRGLKPLAVLLLLTGVSVSACGDVSDVNTGKTGGKSGSGGDAGDGPIPSGGDGPMTQGGTTSEPPLPCEPGERSCDGNTPRECNSKNEWVLEEKCGGSTKVCTGKGECVPYRLLNAGIDSFGVRPAEGAIVLKEQTLSAAPRSCGKVAGQDVCVTGGIR